MTPRPTIKIESVAELGMLIARRRAEKATTQQDLADFAGVGRRFLIELEGGKETAEIGKVLRVINALGADFLIRGR